MLTSPAPSGTNSGTNFSSTTPRSSQRASAPWWAP